MLNLLDDFPIHQTPEPLAHPATSDRNFFDRTWFNGYSVEGDWYFGVGMAIYRHRGILDCAFSVVEKGGRQHCFFASLGSESFDPRSLDLQDPHNLHLQQVVRVSDGSREGIGVLEHACLGSYTPYGLTGISQGANFSKVHPKDAS